MISEKLKERLGEIVDFRIGREAKKDHPLVFKGLVNPSTDGKNIYLPWAIPFSSQMLTDVVRHEADHIKEMKKLSLELSGSQEVDGGKEYIEEFFFREQFAENPTLAFDTWNVVEDNRIDTDAREELPGSKRIFEKEKPDLLRKRPSTMMMRDLDKFRELLLQKALLGETKEKVPEKWEELLQECAGFVREAEGTDIPTSLSATEKIYLKMKENFDIRQKIIKLPPLFGRGEPMRGFRIPQNYDEGKAGKEKGPKKKQGGEEKEKKRKRKPGGEKKPKEKKPESKKPGKPKSKRRSESWMCDEDRKISLPTLAGINPDSEVGKMIEKYAGEIESMVRVLRQIKKENLTLRLAKEGEDLEIEDYIQAELEEEATGIKPEASIFLEKFRNKLSPAWVVLADVSISTADIIDEIKATMIVLAESLKRSNLQFGLYAFNTPSDHDVLYKLKEFEEKYSVESIKRVMGLYSDHSTGMADSIAYLANNLKKLNCHPKGLIIVSDGEPNYIPPVKRALEEAKENKIVSFFIVLGSEHRSSIERVVKEYVLVERDEIFRLPAEILRIFRAYRIGR